MCYPKLINRSPNAFQPITDQSHSSTLKNNAILSVLKHSRITGQQVLRPISNKPEVNYSALIYIELLSFIFLFIIDIK